MSVNLYTFAIMIDGKTYSGRIPAKSWYDAQSRLPYPIDGMLTEVRCAKCKTIIEGEDVLNETWEETIDT
jgi:hypothetical protein